MLVSPLSQREIQILSELKTKRSSSGHRNNKLRISTVKETSLMTGGSQKKNLNGPAKDTVSPLKQ